MSLKQADSLTPEIQLTSIITFFAGSDYKTDRLIVASPSYMKNLTRILSSTSLETLQTYFIWKVVQAFASEIEADEIKPYTRFSNKLQGKVTHSTFSVDASTHTYRTLTRRQSVGELALATSTMGLVGY
jgi:predicted metalloendopeptidase